LFEKEHKGPISAVAQIDGLLLVSIGPKILLYQFRESKNLIGKAFYDAQLFAVNVNTIKNYILLADMYKSIHFLRWKEPAKQLALESKDVDHMNIFATEFLIDEHNLTILVSDSKKNFHMYSFAPSSKESRGGQKLLCIGNFHAGATVNKLLRVRMSTLKNAKQKAEKYCVFFGTLDGGTGYIAPIAEEKFKRLGKLEMRLVSALPHYAGLNPKAFRLTKPERKMSHNHHRKILDGELLWKYAFLERSKQDELAQLTGTTTEEILDNLLEIDLATFF